MSAEMLAGVITQRDLVQAAFSQLTAEHGAAQIAMAEVQAIAARMVAGKDQLADQLTALVAQRVRRSSFCTIIQVIGLPNIQISQPNIGRHGYLLTEICASMLHEYCSVGSLEKRMGLIAFVCVCVH